MGSLWLMLLWSCAFGGYGVARLKTMTSKTGRGLLWASIVSNAVAGLIIISVIAVFSQKVS